MSEWRAIPGYEGFYEVSSTGSVRSVDRYVKIRAGGLRLAPAALVKQRPHSDGYMKVDLSRLGAKKQIKVHRLVAMAFVPGEAPGLHVCHNDGNYLNNRAENLRWDTQASNNRDIVLHGNHWNMVKTHCPSGHPYDEENTKWYRGWRYCRACSQARKRSPRKREAEATASAGGNVVSIEQALDVLALERAA